MRSACNKCPKRNDFHYHACITGNINNWIFVSAISELRGLFGVIIGQIAKAYGLDVENELAQIIPQ